MNILHIMASVDPRSGGPIEALRQADVVGRRLGHQRTVVSLDLSQDPWVRSCPIETFAVGSATAKAYQPSIPALRYGFTPHLIPWLQKNASRFDRIVVNGLWNFTALAARLVLPYQPTPYFVFPHGMLDPWFRRAYPVKHWCKQIAWWAAEGPLLHKARAVLFTSEGERQAAAGAFRPYRFRQIVTGYGTGDAPPETPEQRSAFHAAASGLGERPFLLFLGRLHPKKGCDLLLRAFAAVGPALQDHDLVMAGPDQAGWQPSLQTLAQSLGIGARVHWTGMLDGAAKWGALRACRGFILPSHGENFGIAVAEALSCGKPALLTDKVNICRDLIEGQAAFVASDTETGIIALLTRFAGLDDDTRHVMGRRARACFLDKFLVDTVAARTLAILEDGGDRP